jgi:non-specific serine/threonine protein kinase
VGRWGEIDRVLERFYFSRAVTICGPAGLGKTRTAIQVAHELVDRQPDGVWFVDLGMIKSGSLVADMILRSLPRRLTEDGPALDSLQKMLADKELLLVLDNVEHVLSEAARVVDALSRSCPNVQFLSTSREPLGIDGESVIRLGPLRTPHPGAALDDVIGSEAMMLLLDRIRIQDPDFEPDLGELGLLAEACREVDGIPLALELVASRMQSMSPRAVLRTLRANRNMAGNRMAHGRHSSLQDALEWGYTSLQPPAQLLFHRVSVFAGGFTLQAAGDVCSDEDLSRQDIEAAIDELHRCSLLIRDSGRYRMLRPLRDFAQEKLRRSEGVEAMRDRHLDWMIELAESAPGQPDRHGAWLSALEPELANAREAMEWARTSSNDDRAFRLAYGLYDFWYPRSMAIEGALEIRRTLRSSRRLDWLSKARLFNAKAVLEMERGDLETALADYQSAARLAKKNGDQMTETRILANIAIVMRRLGKGKEAYQSGDELLRRMPEGEPMWIGQQLNVAAAAMDVGEFEDARRRIEIVFELAVTTRSEHFLGHVFLSRGELATRLGKFDEAQEQLERGFLVFEGLADMRTTGIAIALLIVAVTGAGLHRQAAAYHGCLENLRSEVAVHLTPQLQTALDNAASSLRQALGESEFNLEQDRGRSLGLGDLARHLRNRLGELDHTER